MLKDVRISPVGASPISSNQRIEVGGTWVNTPTGEIMANVGRRITITALAV
jgi:hypothetical protein